MYRIIFILLIFWNLNIFGQTDDITPIRNHYKKVNEQIALCGNKNNEDCNLYSNEIIINSKQKMWRAVGNYQQKITFWYTNEPRFAKAEDKQESSVLLKVTIARESAANNEVEEWLFCDGELQFFYIKLLNATPTNNIEARYYFKNKKLIKTIISDESKNFYNYNTATILDKSTTLVHLFLKTFEI